jgi:hypothetical protein
MSEHKQFRRPVSGPEGLWVADLYIAAFLVARNHRIQSLSYVGPGQRFAFIFDHDATLEADCKLFSRSESLQQFVGAISFVKKLLRDEGRKR